jgi:hypothetical protein
LIQKNIYLLNHFHLGKFIKSSPTEANNNSYSNEDKCRIKKGKESLIEGVIKGGKNVKNY